MFRKFRGVRLIRKCPFFLFSYLLHLSTSFFRKTSEVKKIPWTNLNLQYQFCMNIFRHHREIAFVKHVLKQTLDKLLTLRCDGHRKAWLSGMMHTRESDSAVWCTSRSFLEMFITWLCGVQHTAELDSAVGCTPRSVTPRYDSHCGVWLCGGMHTAELFKNSNISAKSKLNSKIL